MSRLCNATGQKQPSHCSFQLSLLQDKLELIHVVSPTAGCCCCIAPETRGCTFTQSCSVLQNACSNNSVLLKNKGWGDRKSDLFYACEDFHREEIRRNIYNSLILERKASEKIHDCKLKPVKFQLEMKSNFNQNYHPLSSLKTEYWIVLTKPHCIRSKKVFCGYTVVDFFYS